MSELDSFGQALAGLIGVRNTESGKLGYIVGGEWHVVDPDNPSHLLVRFVNGTHVSARNERGVAAKYDMAVIVGTDFLGRPIILGEDVAQNQNFHPSGSTGGSIPFHTHARGSGMEFIVDEWAFKHLRVTTSTSTLTATISAGAYLYDHDLRWKAAESLDLTSYVPSTFGYYRWVVISIDPISDSFVATAMSEAFLASTVADPADIPLVDFLANGNIPLAAIWLAYGDTGIPSYRIEDLRYATGSIFWYLEDLVNVSSDSDYEDYVLTRKGDIWIGQPSVASSGSLPNFGAQVIVTIAAGVLDISGVSGRNIIVAAETGTSDTVDTITGLAEGEAALFVADAGDTITFAHGTDNIDLYADADITISGSKALLLTSPDGALAVQPVDKQGAGGAGYDYLHYEYRVAANTPGGGATSGSWQTRPLNTEVADTGSNGALSSNQVTLDSGTYELWAAAWGYGGLAGFALRWYNVSDTAVAVNHGGWDYFNANYQNHTFCTGRFTIASTKTFELQGLVRVSHATDGMGTPMNTGGETECYATVIMRKVA